MQPASIWQLFETCLAAWSYAGEENNKNNDSVSEGEKRRGETDNIINNISQIYWLLATELPGWQMGVLYLCFVLGLGPGVGRGVLTWLMSSILARGARGALALTILSLLDMINFTGELSQVWELRTISLLC